MQDIHTFDFLNLVLDTMPGDVVVRDAVSTIIYANQAFAEAYGLTVDSILGRTNAELWAMLGRPQEQIERWLEEDRAVIETGRGQEYIQEIIRPNGERAYFHNFKECLVLPDGRRLLLAQYADITEHKRLERWLAFKENEAAELAGIHKTAVTYAHEINNPLTGILGLVQLMLDCPDCPPEFGEMLQQVRTAANRITKVIQQMEAVELPKTREYLGRNVLLDLRSDEAADGSVL